MKYSGSSLPQSRGEGGYPLPCWPQSFECNTEYLWLSWSWGHAVGSWATCCTPGHPGSSLQSSFPAGQPLSCTDACSYSSPPCGKFIRTTFDHILPLIVSPQMQCCPLLRALNMYHPDFPPSCTYKIEILSSFSFGKTL